MHSTDDLEDGYFGSGSLLSKSIKKHGKEKHHKEILEHLPSREALKLREKEFVNEELLGDKLCMNLRLGGEGGGKFKDAEHQRKCSAAGNLAFVKRMAEDPALRSAFSERAKKHRGRKHTDEAKANMAKARSISNPWVGREHLESTRLKMSASHVGKHDGSKNSQFGTCWVTNGNAVKIKVTELDEYLAIGYRRGRIWGQ
jgi:hypothetical protein